jgi:biofilm PGA synthesis N-glycosyltransferase PgaC
MQNILLDPEINYRVRITLVFVFCVSIISFQVDNEVALLTASIVNLFLSILVLIGFYITVQNKYILSIIASTLWATLSINLSLQWIDDLAHHVGYVIAVMSIYGIAIIPGFMNSFLLVSLFLDRRPGKKTELDQYPPVTILVAAYNEESSIARTVESIASNGYKGSLQVIIIDDGSVDRTTAIVRELLPKYSWLRLITLQENSGKSSALNTGLHQVTTALTVTIDADSQLHPGSLQNIVERYLNDPPGTAAIAGHVLAGNPGASIISGMQEWDYLLGIAAVKRMQSLYQGTLVAQGAFSIYETKILRIVGGWPKCVGEDIVLTWAILQLGKRIGYAENACVFTDVPTSLKQFIRQRQRWSRGLIEAFKAHGSLLINKRFSTIFIWWNVLFLYLDLVYTLVFLPGVVAALFGYYWIAGPMTLAVLPIAVLINLYIYAVQSSMLHSVGIKPSRRWGGFILYTLLYGIILQPACVFGYIKEIFNGGVKNWGTK